MSNKKIIFLVLALVIFMFPGKAAAYTGSDLLTVKFTSNWADNSNFYFSDTDNVKYSMSVFNVQLAAMMSTINSDMSSHGATYYLIGNITQAGTPKSIRYTIIYLNTLIGTNGLLTGNYDSYAYSSGSYGEIQFRKSINIVGYREILFSNSTGQSMTLNTYNNSTSYYMSSILGYSLNIGYGTLYIPSTFFPATNISVSDLKNLNFVPNTYGGYPNLKFNDTSLTKGTVYQLSNFLDPYVSINMKNIYSILFVWKDFRSVKQNTTVKGSETYCCPQNICGGGASCDLNYFKYIGEYKYGYWNLDINQLGRERYTSQQGDAEISYDDWKYIGLSIGSGGLYGDWRDKDQLYSGTFTWGYIFYNTNMIKDSYITYNSNLFNYYIIAKTDNNTSQSITYTDINGTSQTKTITDAIYTDVVSHYVSDNIFENINDFILSKNEKIVTMHNLMDQIVEENQTVASFLTFAYCLTWIAILIKAIRW